MKQPTPFAQLGYTTKSASSLGWTAADIGIGSIPVVGSAWNLGRGIYHGAKGNWGQAAGSLVGAGLGLFGLGGAANAATKGVVAGANAAGKLSMGARAANGIAQAAKGTGVVAGGAKALMHGGGALTRAGDAAGRVIGKIPGVSQNIAQPLGQIAVQEGVEGAATGLLTRDLQNMAGATGAAAPQAAAPTMAPSWYQAVTGQAAMPQY